MEFDHFFICTNEPARDAALLREFGLIEGTGNTHRGQGTANHRFFFRNAFLELLFVQEESQLSSRITRPTYLYERLIDRQVEISPFGICFRPTARSDECRFPHWNYKPKYLPSSFEVSVGNAPPTEPMWFHLAFAERPDKVSADKRQPMSHRYGIDQISGARIVLPVRTEMLSEVAKVASQSESFDVEYGEEHLLELELNHERQHIEDFRPTLPLKLLW